MSKLTELIENGEQQSLTDEQIQKLTDANLIYPCTECGCFHIAVGKNWDDIDKCLEN